MTYQRLNIYVNFVRFSYKCAYKKLWGQKLRILYWDKKLLLEIRNCESGIMGK